jgi:hypothetical protein
MHGPIFPPAPRRQAAPNISGVADFQDGNRLADDKPVAREGNGVLESLSERLELFVVTVGINRDLFDEPIQIVRFPDIARGLYHA